MQREEFVKAMSEMNDDASIDWERAYEVMQMLSENHARETDIPAWQVQLVVMMEELSELSCEVSKIVRCREDRATVLEELADVVIMTKYLQRYMGYSDEDLQKAMKVKLHRYDWVLDNLAKEDGENKD